MAVRAETPTGSEAEPAATPIDGPLAIEVRDLHKAFQIPAHRVDTLKERVLHPFARRGFTPLHALDGVSFEVHRGEFFGIVGRNGSGKSTLLKILASIYGADSGTVRIAGRLAPFIELGVGFNTELTARENVELNGVMMGLTPREARSRLDAVLDFAELREFAELRLKNYSSGMLVRLAFSVMLEADADVMLIDEVLAVGDAAFQQKCADVFHRMRDQPDKTVVLVTHDMSAVERYCHRSLLLNDGRIDRMGEPDQVARRYLQVNFEESAEAGTQDEADRGAGVWFSEASVGDSSGQPVSTVEHGKDIRVDAVIEADRELPDPAFGVDLRNAAGVCVFALIKRIDRESGSLQAGDRLAVRLMIENRLSPGRYYIRCSLGRAGAPPIAYLPDPLTFVVFGDPGGGGGKGAMGGVVRLGNEIEFSDDSSGEGE
jgi:ABC-2 type transport system ATP-binding protein